MSQDISLQIAIPWRAMPAPRWAAAVALALAVGVIYFYLARLGLELQRHGVAVFWPAAGVSAGTFIALGRRGRWSVAAGVAVGNVAANLLADRNLWGAGVFSLADVGEAFLVAVVIEQRFGDRFELDRLSHVLGLLAAVVGATATSGVIAAYGYVLFHPGMSSMASIWQEWCASDALGIVTVAPMLIGFAAVLRCPPRRAELFEGIVALGLLAAVSGLVLCDGRGPWALAVPLALSFPLLLWIGARCPPVFAAAASLIATTTIDLTMTFGTGIFGDPALPADDRIQAARAGMLAVTLCALVLAALFAERRRQEAALRESAARLEQSAARLEEGLALSRVSSFAWDRHSGATRRSANAAQMFGFDPKQDLTSAQFLAHVHPEDRARFTALLRGTTVRQLSYNITFRFIRPDGGLMWLHEVSKLELDAAGRCVGVTGLTRDITAKKRADQALRESEERLRVAIQAGRMGTWERDDQLDVHVWSDEFYRIFGFRVGEVPPSRASWLTRVHPEDRESAEAAVNNAERNITDYVNEFRIVRPDGTVRWVRVHGRFLHRGSGRVRTIGLVEDVTEAKQYIDTQRVLVAELQHRTRNLVAVVQSIAHRTLDTAESLADFESRFDRRLEALSRVQSLLSRADSSPITVGALIRMELDAIAAVGFGERVVVRGPDVTLRKSVVEMLSLAVHELATNAVKYGALVTTAGRLSVTWQIDATTSERQLVLDWIERAIAPQSDAGAHERGYGRTLIEEALPYSLGAKTRFELGADSLHCRIILPLTTQGLRKVAA